MLHVPKFCFHVKIGGYTACLTALDKGSCLKTGQHSISVIIKIIICIFVFGAVSQILFKMVMYLSWIIKKFDTHFDNTNGQFKRHCLKFLCIKAKDFIKL